MKLTRQRMKNRTLRFGVITAFFRICPHIPPTQKSTSTSKESNGYTVVYVDGACNENGGVSPRAEVGVWFGPNHPLNIFRCYKGQLTNNAS